LRVLPGRFPEWLLRDGLQEVMAGHDHRKGIC
jgi:hypothetical protein